MSRRILTPLLALPGLLLAAALHAPAQEGGGKEPTIKYALELRVRKAGEGDFGKTTRRYGVECYVDGHNGNGLYLSDTGSVSAVSAKLFKGPEGKIKEPVFLHGLTLAARKPTEKEFSKETRRYGIEVFRDENNGNLVYICATGSVAVVPASFAPPAPGPAPAGKVKVKEPVFRHAMNLKVRRAGEKDFGKDTKRYGIEVFSDENNGNLVYLGDTGSIAVVPAKLSGKGSGKSTDPDWQHGMELDVRKAGESAFTKDTKKYGIEVFADEYTGNLVYLCETGAIAVVPAKLARRTEGRSKSPELKHAMELSARKGGEAAFSKTTRKYGLEVYSDENNASLLYICETGDLSVVPGKVE
jgi:hypothetical protein